MHELFLFTAVSEPFQMYPWFILKRSFTEQAQEKLSVEQSLNKHKSVKYSSTVF
jgi:hypothetical protein